MKHELRDKIMTTMMTQNGEKIEEIAECMSTIIDDILKYSEKHNNEISIDIQNKLHVLINGEHLNEKMACDWVNKMLFDKGQPMTKEQADTLAKGIGVDFEISNFNCWDWYAIINMAVSTMYDYASTAEDYADFALGFFKDPLAKQGKAYRYYKYLIDK